MAKDKDKAKPESAGAPAKKSVLMSVIVPLVLVTLLAGGGGFAFGSLVIGKPAKPEAVADAAHGEKPVAEGEVATASEAAAKPEEGHASPLVRQLAPIVTNLQSPKDAWIRLELSLVMKADAASEQDLIAVRANDKVLGLLRSTVLSQIDGPSGLLHLREDLTDLLVGGHDGPVLEVLINSMVVE